ncbi:MAG: hypothetical protein PWR26_841 [Methanosarcinales archaeon]|nr:MAG: Uncharacterized protein XD62_0640 [Methanosarcinales archeaon 56_1174]MDI3488124.1 hypothetical protein [Methanosarcinales archaeon]
MPGLDRTGPLGLGPMTGRGLGLCLTGVDPKKRLEVVEKRLEKMEEEAPEEYKERIKAMREEVSRMKEEGTYTWPLPMGLGWGRGLGRRCRWLGGLGMAWRRGWR